jgi:Pregnancy-associated plasma protein-A
MNYFKSISLLAGFSLFTFVACQKDSALNQARIGEETPIEELSSFARQCSSHEHNNELMAQDAQFKQNQAGIEEFTSRFVANYAQNATNRVVVKIPVVVHVIYKTAAENITQAQVQSQIDILNADFRKLNSEIGAGKTLVGVPADCEITFVLSQTVRKLTTTTSFSTNNAVKKGTVSTTVASVGGSNPISPTTKLNIWVCTLGNGILGYAQFPGGASATDGVVCLNKAFGNTGTAATPFNKGRTATHEVGHWLNLRHIWGDATCGSDLVTDTPLHNTANYGCPAVGHKSTCTGTPAEMWMNYMDYTDDACMYMFSTGQKARMQATLAAGGSRASYIMP